MGAGRPGRGASAPARAGRSGSSKREGRGTDTAKFRMEMKGVAYIFVALFLFLCVFSFNPLDPTFNQAVSPSHRTTNLAGAVGSYIAGFLVEIFGLGALIWPMLLAWFGLAQFSDRFRLPWYRWAGLGGLVLSLMAWMAKPWALAVNGKAPSLASGGFIGKAAAGITLELLSPWGSVLFWMFLSVATVQVSFGVSWSKVFAVLLGLLEALFDKALALWESRRETKGKPVKVAAPAPAPARRAEPRPSPAVAAPEAPHSPGDDLILRPFEAPAPKKKSAEPRAEAKGEAAPELPGPELLREVPVQPAVVDSKALQAKARQLTACLGDFNIQGEIQQVMPGPVVTMFEFKPAPGVKISTIAARNDDIALSLKALAVRIEAPIPGKDTVGVEIPNEKRQTVSLREIIESPVFAMAKSPLTLAVGKDIQGAPQIADLAAMPHLLVAGATGAGKSVCLNGFLVSILYKASPEQVKLLLIDPKRIELAMYADLPHLVHPVVTDMALAKSALDWCVAEMDRRYEAMARLGVRNIDGYNEKAAKLAANPGPDVEAVEHMPYLVLIIDELADLMMTAAKEVEIAIVRLAQLARAAGIHMILATQRPSVDVVTGLIKANFPTRIAFQVTSRHDSRTILDTVGAEHLLGRGDMLFKPSGAKMVRMHGAFVSDEESARVVEYWKERQAPSYLMDLSNWNEENAGGEGGFGGSGDGESLSDPVYPQALEFVMEQGKASISLIQRRFRIGFNRAARFIEQMERDGLLGPADGSKPRVVLKGKD